MKNSLKNKSFIGLVLAYLFFAGLWLSFRSHVAAGGTSVQFFNATYGLLALLGGVAGLWASRRWGGFKSILGRAILMFALGLFAQEFGQLAYDYYYYVMHVAAPYPSIGDVGFFGSIPLYIYGTALIGKAAGVSLSLRNIKGKLLAIIIPLAILAFSYTMFLRGYQFDWSHPVTIFLDFGYPFGQAIYISLAILALLFSRKLLGGLMRSRILLILVALCAQYAADFTFLYQTQKQTWVAGGINDFMYLTSYFIMAVALLNLGTLYTALRNNPSPESDEV